MRYGKIVKDKPQYVVTYDIQTKRLVTPWIKRYSFSNMGVNLHSVINSKNRYCVYGLVDSNRVFKKV